MFDHIEKITHIVASVPIQWLAQRYLESVSWSVIMIMISNL